jgi:hypothetical protein
MNFLSFSETKESHLKLGYELMKFKEDKTYADQVIDSDQVFSGV